MRKSFSIILSAAMLTGAITVPTVFAGTEVIGQQVEIEIPVPNGSFEETADTPYDYIAPGKESDPLYTSRPMPTHWTRVCTSNDGGAIGAKLRYNDFYTETVDMEKNPDFKLGSASVGAAADGKNVFHLKSAGGLGANDGPMVYRSDLIRVEAGTCYRYSLDAFILAKNHVALQFYDADGRVFSASASEPVYTAIAGDGSTYRNAWPYGYRFTGKNSDPLGTDSAWATLSFNCIAPPQAAYAAFVIAAEWDDAHEAVFDNFRLFQVCEAKLAIPNASFKSATNGWKAGTGAAIEAADSTKMRDASNLKISGGRAESDFFPAFGEGTYWLDFDAYGENNKTGKYSVECFDKDFNQLAADGNVIGAYSADMALTNEKNIPLRGRMVMNTVNAAANFIKASDVTFHAPANTAYLKIYFTAPDGAEFYTDNLAGAYRSSEEEQKTTAAVFKDTEGNSVLSISAAAGREISASYTLANIMDTSFTALGVLALYEKNTNKLIDIKTVKKEFTSYMVSTFASQNITVPAENTENYYLKFMTVSGIETMIPLVSTEMVLR